MIRTFIETPMFTRRWHELGLTDNDLRILQNWILTSPGKAGKVIQGTGGLRKIRVPYSGHGKRGGARVLFLDVDIQETVYLINVYAKSEQGDITEAERKAFASVVAIFREGKQ